MRLAALLSELSAEHLERLRTDHFQNDNRPAPMATALALESILKSYAFVRKFVGDSVAPTFSMLELLLEAPNGECDASSFRDRVEHHAHVLTARIEIGDLLGRDSNIQLYRRVLLEARRNDLALDPSETAILGVLRRELGVRPVEHFLIEYHKDFRELWSDDHTFKNRLDALTSCGLLFHHGSKVVVAEEIVPLLRQTLGLEMTTSSRRRMYELISGVELSEILNSCQLKSSGSREEKIERLVGSYIQPSEVLQHLSLVSLKETCRVAGAPASGAKDDLIERLVRCFLHNEDEARAEKEEPPVELPHEPRVLEEARLKALFTSLTGNELTEILDGIDSSRRTGAKETKIELLLRSRFCEVTLLERLSNRSLEGILVRLHLKTSGSKREKADRLVDFFLSVAADPLVAESLGNRAEGTRLDGMAVSANDDKNSGPE